MIFELDERSVYLLGGCALALLVQLLVLRNPAPLLHPILLGRQGESARVRKLKESAVWHHASAASSSMLVARPLAAIKGLRDVVDAFEASDKLRVQSIAAQLRAHFGSYQDGSKVVLLLDETEDAVALIAAFSYLPQIAVLLVPDAEALSDVSKDGSAIVVSAALLDRLPSFGLPVFVRSESLPDGASNATLLPILDPSASPTIDQAEVKSDPDKLALSFVVKHDEKWVTVELTNMNVTASVYNISQMFTGHASLKLSDKDKVASFFPPSTPFGFLAALSVLFAKSKLCICSDLSRTKAMLLFEPNVIFFTPAQARRRIKVLIDDLPECTAVPAVARYTWGCKLASLRQGVLEHGSLSDKFALNSFRAKWSIDRARALAVFCTPGEELSYNEMDALRILFNAPVVHGLLHPLQPFPLTASHLHDFQMITVKPDERSHTGPPCINAAVKLLLDEEQGEDMTGMLLVDSPAVARPAKNADEYIMTSKRDGGENTWFKTGYRAHLFQNGVLRSVVPEAAAPAT